VLYDFHMGGADEEGSLEVTLLKSYVKDPKIFPNKTASYVNTGRASSGVVRDIKFLDLDVAQSLIALRHYLGSGSSSPVPSVDGITSLLNAR
jgi:hypothetical protein